MRMVKGLGNEIAALIIAARADRLFTSAEEVWRRSGISSAALACLARADAFLPSLQLTRREALWAIKGLRDNPLPLFKAADEKANRLQPEADEPLPMLKAMTAGREVVEDYRLYGPDTS